MRVSKPPKLQDLQKEYAKRQLSALQRVAEAMQCDEFIELSDFTLPEYPEFSVTDNHGQYVHWDKFRRIHSHDTRMKWRAVQLSRLRIQRQLNFPFNHQFKFCTPDSLQAQLHIIDKTCGSYIGTNSLVGLGQQEQNQFLLKSLMMEEAITSAQLEGAATTRQVAKDLLKTQRKPKTKDEMMIVNNYHLMKHALARKDEPLSVEMILDLHAIATHNAIENHAVSGEFRRDNDIFIADNDGNHLYQPPDYQQIPELMVALCDFANEIHDDLANDLFLHPVYKAIILHFLVGYIHPFGDGNGRTARALFYWFMLKNGYWLFEYISISRLLKNAPAQYAKAYLEVESDDLDLTYFVYYQANIIRRAIDDLQSYIANKQKQQHQFKRMIAQKTFEPPLNHRQIGILQKAVEESGKIFTAQEIANQYGVSLNTARKDLLGLSEQNLLIAFPVGKAMEYISPQDLMTRLQ